MKVFVVVYSHRFGIDLAAFSTHERAVAYAEALAERERVPLMAWRCLRAM